MTGPVAGVIIGIVALVVIFAITIILIRYLIMSYCNECTCTLKAGIYNVMYTLWPIRLRSKRKVKPKEHTPLRSEVKCHDECEHYKKDR